MTSIRDVLSLSKWIKNKSWKSRLLRNNHFLISSGTERLCRLLSREKQPSAQFNNSLNEIVTHRHAGDFRVKREELRSGREALIGHLREDHKTNNKWTGNQTILHNEILEVKAF
jgi:hypothetical protein